MKYVTIYALLIIWLTGCQGSLLQMEADENSRYFRIPVDSKLILQQALVVPARSDRLYFQKGRVSQFQYVNEYLPYCALSLYAKKDAEYRIAPDTFIVRKMHRQHLFDLAMAPPLFAQLEPGGGMTYQVVATLMEIRSVKQPDVIRMTCANWGIPQDIAHLTLGQMREALGDWFLLKLPKQHKP